MGRGQKSQNLHDEINRCNAPKCTEAELDKVRVELLSIFMEI